MPSIPQGFADGSKPESFAALIDALTEPLVVFLPGLAIYLTVFAINLVGNGLRDALDPRLTD